MQASIFGDCLKLLWCAVRV